MTMTECQSQPHAARSKQQDFAQAARSRTWNHYHDFRRTNLPIFGSFQPIPALALLMVYANRRRHAVLARLGNPVLVKRLGASVNWRGRRWQTGLWFASIVLLLLSLARPQWGEDVQVVDRTGVQVMVALDVSESMLAEDIKPNRLSRAKLEIADLMSRLGGDEIGLVLFSGASFIQFPLTSDYTTAQSFLDGARPGVISKPGTNIGDAVRTALTGFDDNSNSQRVIVLITDGEAHDAEAMNAVQQAADEGVIFYTIGFGSPEGVPIPEMDAAGNVVGFKTDRNGETVLSRLDEETLAEHRRHRQRPVLPGFGQRRRVGCPGRRAEPAPAGRDRLPVGSAPHRAISDLSGPVAGPSGHLNAHPGPCQQPQDGPTPQCDDGRKGICSMKKALIAFVFAGLTLTACGSGAEKLNEAGNEAYANNDYAAAVEKYQEAATADPELAAPLYNTANALYRQEAYDQVPAALQVAMAHADETLTQQSHYNLGNSLFKAEDYEGAVEAYKEALRFDPQDLDAKVNLELTLKQLQQDQQEQQDQEQNQDQQDEQNQDQQQENQDQQEQDQQEQNQDQQQEHQDQQEGQDQQDQQDQEQDQQGQENQDEPQGRPQDQESDGQQGDQEQEQPQDQQQGDQEQEQPQEPEQQDDPQEGQDGDNPQDQEPQDSEPQDPNGEAGDQPEEPQEPQPGLGQLAQQLEGLSEEQARQLLIAASQGTETLQEYLQQIYLFPNDSVEQDW